MLETIKTVGFRMWSNFSFIVIIVNYLTIVNNYGVIIIIIWLQPICLAVL